MQVPCAGPNCRATDTLEQQPWLRSVCRRRCRRWMRSRQTAAAPTIICTTLPTLKQCFPCTQALDAVQADLHALCPCCTMLKRAPRCPPATTLPGCAQALDAVQADLDALSSCCEAMGGSLAGSRAAAADLLHDTDRLTRALQVRLAAAPQLLLGSPEGSRGPPVLVHRPAQLARWLQEPACCQAF